MLAIVSSFLKIYEESIMDKEEVLRKLQELPELQDYEVGCIDNPTRLSTDAKWGITLRKKGDALCVMLYDDNFENEKEVPDIIHAAINEQKRRSASVMATIERSSADFLKSLFIEVYNYEHVKEKLNDLVYYQVQDVVVVLYSLIEKTGDGILSMPVNRNYLYLLFKSEVPKDSDLFMIAKGNTVELLGLKHVTMDKLLEKLAFQVAEDAEFLSGFEPLGTELLVITNDGQTHGAALIFIEEVQKFLFGLYGPFYVIPSSVHETLLITGESYRNFSVDEFTGYIAEVNNEVLVPADILSYHVFHYDGNELNAY